MRPRPRADAYSRVYIKMPLTSGRLQPRLRGHHGHPGKRTFSLNCPAEDLVSRSNVQRLQVPAAEDHVRRIALVGLLQNADRFARRIHDLDPEFRCHVKKTL